MQPTPDLVLDGGPPPWGRVSIEASAGTGKTYSLTQLVVLHVIHHGLTPEEVLLVTFTRAATAELRHKTRDMCQRALAALVNHDASDLTWLATVIVDDTLRQDGIVRLNRFISRYDEANISTIHGFCQRVLRRAGLSSPVPAHFTVVENIDDVVDRVVTDTLAPLLADNPSLFTVPLGDPPPEHAATRDVAASVKEIRSAVKRAIGNSSAKILPRDNDDHLSSMIASTVDTIIGAVATWCAENGVVTHDDLVRLAASPLASRDEHGAYTSSSAMLARDIGAQVRLVMVDEFQDTDEMQWRIFESIHHHGRLEHDRHTLVTVGDAKQAIYRFRGADVGVYTRAEHDVANRYRLSTNRRSNPALLAGLEHLFTSATGEGFSFDNDDLVRFVPVAPDGSKPGLLTLSGPVSSSSGVTDSPVEIRWVPRDLRLNGNKTNKTGALGQNLSALVSDSFMNDLTDRIAELLRHARVPDDRPGRDPSATRPVTPGDIAVLVNYNSHANEVVAALREARVPAVQTKTASVLTTEAAFQFMLFLEGVAHPQRVRKVKACALSLFGPLDVDSLLGITDEQIGELQQRCAADAERLQQRGLTALYMHHRTDPAFLERVLTRPDGERMLTDLDHIAELLASHPLLARRTSAAETLAVLTELIDDDDGSEERKRRIETDDSAVNVMTMHASKGLQFPIVILPTLHLSKPRENDTPYMFTHDVGDGPTRLIDVASGTKEAREWTHAGNGVVDPVIGTHEARKALDRREAMFERRRLMYVALTRAQHKVIAYWSEIQGNTEVPWANLLGWPLQKPISKMPTDPAKVTALFAELSSKSGGSVACVRIDPDDERPGEWNGESNIDSAPEVSHAEFTGRDEESLGLKGWRRWSYSGLTRIMKGPDGFIPVHEGNHGGDEYDPASPEPGDMPNTVEVETPQTRPDGTSPDRSVTSASPLLDVAGGTALGTLIHEVLDEVDLESSQTDELVAELVRNKMSLWPATSRRSDSTDAVSRGITMALDCPLGPEFGGLTLRTIGNRHRLSELRFDHLLGQESVFSLNDLGALLSREHGLDRSIDDFAAVMCDTTWSSTTIAGHMTGSIDAVLRVTAQDNGDTTTRFFVVDYKSDRIHGDDDPRPEEAYSPARLSTAMTKRGYLIQALVYSVALHRFLRWRLGDAYDFDVHFGGVAYLYLRGMNGDTDPDGRPFGVWQWKPSTSLVGALDALFARDSLAVRDGEDVR